MNSFLNVKVSLGFSPSWNWGMFDKKMRTSARRQRSPLEECRDVCHTIKRHSPLLISGDDARIRPAIIPAFHVKT